MLLPAPVPTRTAKTKRWQIDQLILERLGEA